MRRAAKIDGTQTEIVAALRQAGCKVLSLAACGNGVPDLLVYIEPCGIWHGKMHLLEVKNPKGRGITLTPDQIEFHRKWPVTVVTSVDEALAAVGLSGSVK